MPHTHEVAHWPHTTSGVGWGVCECGATIRIDPGSIGRERKQSDWHACERCSTEPTTPSPQLAFDL